MSLNKNLLLILASLALLAGGIFFSWSQKKSYKETYKELVETKKEISTIKSLQRVWGAKGVSKKIHLALSKIPVSKKSILLKRKKVNITFNNLTDKELNYALGKLASLPLQFRELKINKVNDNFNMECLCAW